MNRGTSVAQRTRSRKQKDKNFENHNNERWKQHMVGEVKSEDGSYSCNTESDDDDEVIILEEANSKIEEEGKKEPLQGKKLKEKFLEVLSEYKRSQSGCSLGSKHEGVPTCLGVASRTRSYYNSVTKCGNTEPGKFRDSKVGTFDNPISFNDEEDEEEERNRTNTPDVSLESSDFSCDEDYESPKVRLKRRRGEKCEKFKGDEEVSPSSVPSNEEDENAKVMGKRQKVSKPELGSSSSPENVSGVEEGISEDILEPCLSKTHEDEEDEEGSESEEDEIEKLFAELDEMNEYIYNEKIRNEQQVRFISQILFLCYILSYSVM